MGVSSKVLQKKKTAVFVIPKLYSFLLRKSTLLRIFYSKKLNVVSIVAKRGNGKFYSNLELCSKQFFQIDV